MWEQGVLLSSLGLTADSWLGLSKFDASSAGFSERAATTAAVGAVLFTVGTGITLGALSVRLSVDKALVSFFCRAPWHGAVSGTVLFRPRLAALQPERIKEARYAAVPRVSPCEEITFLLARTPPRLAVAPVPTEKPLPHPAVLRPREASRYFRLAENAEAAWALINYRGYGWSTGVPNEAAFFADALAIYDYFAHHPLIDQNRIVALAGSMGTGVAVYLSAQRPLAGVVLFSPYDSIAEAAQDLIPLLPAKLLIRQRFEVVPYAQSTQAPALAIVGEDDAVIRPDRSKSLMNSWARPSETVVIPGGTHYSIYEEETAWAAVRSFLHSLDVI